MTDMVLVVWIMLDVPGRGMREVEAVGVRSWRSWNDR
jgi:hypothetical protein